MPLTSPGNDDDTGENHQPTLRKNTAEPVEQTLKQNKLERALGHRPGWVDYTAMLRERETEYLLGYDSHPSISYDADPFQATPTWSAGAGHGAGYGARI